MSSHRTGGYPPAPPSQGKVERAREILNAEENKTRIYTDTDAKDLNRLTTRGVAIAAITQALTEGSGQGTDGAEATREAAAVCVLSLRELGGSSGYNTALEYAAKQIRALPLPVSFRRTKMVSPDRFYKQQVSEQRHDEDGVAKLSKAMLDKLEQKRRDGRAGWHDPAQCHVNELARMFVEHLPKGDIVDIANFAMMLFNREDGQEALRAALAHAPSRPAPVVASEKLSEIADDYFQRTQKEKGTGREILMRRLRAAFEVGRSASPQPDRESRDAVIEECATVASQYPTTAALAIAANIRSLKSKQPSDTGAGKMTHKCQKCGAPVRPNVDGDLRYYPPRAKKAKRKAKTARVQGRTEHSVIMDAITGHRGIA